MPPQKKLPIIQSVVIKPIEEAVQRELDTRIKALEAAVRRSQETLGERQEAVTPQATKI